MGEPESYGDAAAALSAEVRVLVSPNFVAECETQQMKILGSLQDSSAVLSQFCDFSSRSAIATSSDFYRNTRLLRGMKGDLDHIFRRIRELKERLRKHYPEAYDEAIKEIDVDDERPNLEIEN